MRRYTRFLAKLEAASAAVHGLAVLPVPADGAAAAAGGDSCSSADSSSNADKLHLYEECLLLWTKQIRAVLERNPAYPIAEGGLKKQLAAQLASLS